MLKTPSVFDEIEVLKFLNSKNFLIDEFKVSPMKIILSPIHCLGSVINNAKTLRTRR